MEKEKRNNNRSFEKYNNTNIFLKIISYDICSLHYL